MGILVDGALEFLPTSGTSRIDVWVSQFLPLPDLDANGAKAGDEPLEVAIGDAAPTVGESPDELFT